jgi:hypothetical protein
LRITQGVEELSTQNAGTHPWNSICYKGEFVLRTGMHIGHRGKACNNCFTAHTHIHAYIHVHTYLWKAAGQLLTALSQIPCAFADAHLQHI